MSFKSRGVFLEFVDAKTREVVQRDDDPITMLVDDEGNHLTIPENRYPKHYELDESMAPSVTKSQIGTPLAKVYIKQRPEWFALRNVEGITTKLSDYGIFKLASMTKDDIDHAFIEQQLQKREFVLINSAENAVYSIPFEVLESLIDEDDIQESDGNVDEKGTIPTSSPEEMTIHEPNEDGAFKSYMNRINGTSKEG